MGKWYEEPKLEINYLNREDVLTKSPVSGFGDGWVKDPFVEK